MPITLTHNFTMSMSSTSNKHVGDDVIPVREFTIRPSEGDEGKKFFEVIHEYCVKAQKKANEFRVEPTVLL